MAGRLIPDASLVTANTALPNAANTVNTGVLDLGNNAPFPVTEKITVRVANTQSTGANSKNINVTIQTSNESNANFANIAELGVLQITANSANFPVTTFNITLPPSTKRYIRAQATGEANGGNASDGNITVALLF